MKKSKFKMFSPAFIAGLAIIFLSSCNRGVGCPNNFSIKDFIADLAALITGIF